MCIRDSAYIGSHFIASEESLASPAQKDMVIGAGPADIVYTDRVTGVGANFLRPSLEAATLPEPHGALSVSEEAKAWKTIWSAGHGVGATTAVQPARSICERLIAEYQAALQSE